MRHKMRQVKSVVCEGAPFESHLLSTIVDKGAPPGKLRFVCWTKEMRAEGEDRQNDHFVWKHLRDNDSLTASLRLSFPVLMNK